IGVDALKTGMLSTSKVVRVVAASLQEHAVSQVVVDPVFVAKSGDRLLKEEAIGALVNELFPLALIITPNLHEAGALLGVTVDDLDSMKRAAEELRSMGPRFVLVKGGHLDGTATDVLFDGESFELFSRPKIHTGDTHGTGCTLSAAITAQLAKGIELRQAVSDAKDFVTGAIADALRIGQGHGPTNHGWNLKRND
ncbi:MAG: bifunctional hydroxymethylpyrimidine kinase/phosphomethylpyrimidine kinase, partial [Actinobacteria bacterium]|nr:bifunctional hydroxymethylpyrimidine kinase/phosphomethylpyrimidine kinase [Actinomycetota bacterium]